MSTLREKITFGLTALAYFLFHLRMGGEAQAIIAGTVYQMLVTAPYAIGFTYIIAVVFRRISGTGWPPWDRLLRIFFTVGIVFAFFIALYEYAGQGQPPPTDGKLSQGFSVSRFFEDVTRPAQ